MAAGFDFLKGNIETIILSSLYSSDRYGYEIAREIKDKTDNSYEIKQPTLYSYLKKLEAQDLIMSYWGDESNGGRRRYYKLTDLGRDTCEKYTAELSFHKNVLKNLVPDENADPITQDEANEIYVERTKKKRQYTTPTKHTEETTPAERALILEKLEQIEQEQKKRSEIANISNKNEVKSNQHSLSNENSSEQADHIVEQIFHANDGENSTIINLQSSDISINENESEKICASQEINNNNIQDISSIPAYNRQNFKNYSEAPIEFEDELVQNSFDESSDSLRENEVIQTNNDQNNDQPIFEDTYVETEQSREEFFKRFEDKANDLIKRTPPRKVAEVQLKDSNANPASAKLVEKEETEEEKNYKRLLDNLLSQQLEDEKLHYTQDNNAETTIDCPVALEMQAEKMSEQGIRVKLYNREVASYRPQAMLYKNKINFITAWLTFFTFAILELLLWVAAKPLIDFKTVVIVWIVGAIIPFVLTIVFLINPAKKVKPNYRFSYHLINSLIAMGLLIVLVFALNVLLLKIAFNDTGAVLNQIVLPIVAFINIPLIFVYYKLIFKKMLV